MIIKNRQGEVIFEGERSDLIGAYLRYADLMGADLSYADLMGADLMGANFRDANLTSADLMGASLMHADLRDANLSGADLSDTILRHADLMGADLMGADLRYAYLMRADLTNANLRHADLMGADLRHANLRDANLMGADLRDTILWRADLSDADLTNTKLPEYSIVPIGEFLAFKKVYTKTTKKLAILTVRVPENAERMNSLGSRKVRVSECVPLSAETLGGEKIEDIEFTSYSYHNTLTYKIGEPCFPDSYDPDIRVECSHGIHVFMTKKEAIEF